MIGTFIYKVLDINLLAQWHLSHRSRKQGMFVCRGRIQLSISQDAIVKSPNQICYIGTALLGAGTPKNETTVIACGSNATIALNGTLIGRGSKLSVGQSGQLTVGINSYITDGSRIATQNSITIGKNCAILFGVTIFDDDGHGFGLPPSSAPIVIEDNVWIGCNVIVLKGVTIGEGSVVAAGSVVNKSCPPRSLLAGVPARVVREGVRWTDKSRIQQSLV